MLGGGSEAVEAEEATRPGAAADRCPGAGVLTADCICDALPAEPWRLCCVAWLAEGARLGLALPEGLHPGWPDVGCGGAPPAASAAAACAISRFFLSCFFLSTILR